VRNSPFWRLRFGSLLLCAACGSTSCHESSRAQPSSVASVQSAQSDALPAVSAGAGSGPSPASAGSPSDAAGNGSGTTASGGALSPSEGGSNNGNRKADAADGEPVLVDSDGKALAQTDERPSVGSASFQKRVELVARAIQSGDGEAALSAFFPLLAYQQVKDVAKPERDYKFRLLANFKRDVLEYHRALGADAAAAKFDGISVSEKDAKWMAPGAEGNRVGYFRVLRSRLHFTLPTGRTRDFELTSLISWRGEWYVVHLHGFK
jgi:hypothetical protein